ncbi:carboxylesterase [Neobacillus niacini]|uniref:alpha/beta hydrolase n=1 Tax=Neobacillus niacini TaxID=86668 RepID=UPI0021CB1ED8|nr:alpha/beta fold hydrolase [Neobacillus niacini]MCM3767063.1 alpha/beta fold hydrolase [Neobacillus niacini]
MKESYRVLDGAESFFIEGSKVGILLSHGFMGTPQSVRHLGVKLSQLGYTVFAPLLTGHGTYPHDLENATHGDWISDLEAGYKYLNERCSTIFVMGQSMGGALSLWLANKYPNINGVITINAALSIPDYEYLVGKTSPRFLPEGPPDIRLKGVQEITYDMVPLRAIHEIQALMKKTPDIIPTINQPILCFKSIVDHVVPPENTDYILDHVGSIQKEAVTLYHSYHVASMDHDKDEIIKKTHAFIQGVSAKSTTQQMVFS